MKKQKGFAIPLVIAIIAVLVIGSGVYVYTKNKPAEVSTQNSSPYIWEGKYQFSEGVQGPGSYQGWVYALSISSNTGKWRLVLNVDGFQSMVRINATANNVGDSLDVVFDSNEPNTTLGGYKKGDVLFTLTPTNTGLAIQWKKMQPNLDTSLTGSVFKEVTNSQANWKTYSDSELGFSIQYDPALGEPIKKVSNGSVTADGIPTKQHTTITFGNYEVYVGEHHLNEFGNLNIFESGQLLGKPLTFQQIVTNLKSKVVADNPKISNVTINGTSAVWAEWGYRCACKDFAVYFPYKDTRIVLISVKELGDEESTTKAEAKYAAFAQFAKSFRFTK